LLRIGLVKPLLSQLVVTGDKAAVIVLVLEVLAAEIVLVLVVAVLAVLVAVVAVVVLELQLRSTQMPLLSAFMNRF
jgi:hypothetical protein